MSIRPPYDAPPRLAQYPSFQTAVRNAHSLAMTTNHRYRVERGWSMCGNPWRVWLVIPILRMTDS